MDEQSNSSSRRTWQFSLKNLLAAVLLVGLACAAAKFATSGSPWNSSALTVTLRILSFFSVPILFCAGIGVLRGRRLRWMIYGLLIDLAIICGFLYWLAHIQ